MEGASFSIFPSSLGWVLAVARNGELICLENRVSREDCENAQARRWADAAVVGSGLVNVIAEHGADPDVAAHAGAYVRWLKGQA